MFTAREVDKSCQIDNFLVFLPKVFIVIIKTFASDGAKVFCIFPLFTFHTLFSILVLAKVYKCKQLYLSVIYTIIQYLILKKI